MRIRPISVKAVEKYKIFIQFNDGTEGVYNLQNCAGKGVFKTWEEDDNFFKVFISSESGAITWPNEIDIDTYNAYCIIRGISPEEFFKLSKKEYATDL
jgi:hypothetical protein